jgi:hypothetical protein
LKQIFLSRTLFHTKRENMREAPLAASNAVGGSRCQRDGCAARMLAARRNANEVQNARAVESQRNSGKTATFADGKFCQMLHAVCAGPGRDRNTSDMRYEAHAFERAVHIYGQLVER